MLVAHNAKHTNLAAVRPKHQTVQGRRVSLDPDPDGVQPGVSNAWGFKARFSFMNIIRIIIRIIIVIIVVIVIVIVIFIIIIIIIIIIKSSAVSVAHTVNLGVRNHSGNDAEAVPCVVIGQLLLVWKVSV